MGYCLDPLPWCSGRRQPHLLSSTNSPWSKYPNKEAIGLPWNSGQYLLDCAIFIKRDGGGIPQAKPRNMNIQLILNGYLEDANIFRRRFQESSRAFHPKGSSMEIQTAMMPGTLKSGIYNVWRQHSSGGPPCWYCPISYRSRERAYNRSGNSIGISIPDNFFVAEERSNGELKILRTEKERARNSEDTWIRKVRLIFKS